MQALLAHLQLSDKDWDVLIIGDGAGSGWEISAGWAAVLIDKYSYSRKLFYGGMNTGSVTLGELFPYLHAMLWYTGKDGPGKQRLYDAAAAGFRTSLRIHIVTDSQVVATAGNNPASRHSYPALWAAFDAFVRQGFEITFHHVARTLIDMNILVDEVSRCARLAMTDVFNTAMLKLAQEYDGLPPDATIYDFSA